MSELSRLRGSEGYVACSDEVMAHRPTGSTQTDCIRLPYAAHRLSLSRWGWEDVWKGVHTACPKSAQVKIQDGDNQLRFQPLA